MDIKSVTEFVVNWVFIISVTAPLVVTSAKAIGQFTHNQRLINLSARAEIIVKSLNENHVLQNPQKKEEAMRKLSEYASEVGIKVTADQLSDYIESSIRTLKEIGDAKS